MEWMMDLRRGRERLHGEPCSDRGKISKHKVFLNGEGVSGCVAVNPDRVLCYVQPFVCHSNHIECGCDMDLVAPAASPASGSHFKTEVRYGDVRIEEIK